MMKSPNGLNPKKVIPDKHDEQTPKMTHQEASPKRFAGPKHIGRHEGRDARSNDRAELYPPNIVSKGIVGNKGKPCRQCRTDECDHRTHGKMKQNGLPWVQRVHRGAEVRFDHPRIVSPRSPKLQPCPEPKQHCWASQKRQGGAVQTSRITRESPGDRHQIACSLSRICCDNGGTAVGRPELQRGSCVARWGEGA